MESKQSSRIERTSRRQRRLGSRLAAGILVAGLSIASLTGPTAAAIASTEQDETSLVTNSALENPVVEPDTGVADPGVADPGATNSDTGAAENAPGVTEPVIDDAAEIESGTTELGTNEPKTDDDEVVWEVVESDVISDDADGDMAISPMAVPPATGNNAVITVKVGGNRLADGTVQGLPGVKLQLYGPGTATTGGGFGSGQAALTPVQGSAGTAYNPAWSWTTCVSDAAGDCSFVIPIRTGTTPTSTGVQQDTRFWVVQQASPSGWYANPKMRIGNFGATPDGSWEYRFRTDTRLRAGSTYRSTTPMGWVDTDEWGTPSSTGDPDRHFMRNRETNNSEDWYASNTTRTTGVWSQSKVNPELVASCEIDIALIADTSGSLGPTGMAELKSTMGAFVNAFRGTPARMALFSFANISPGGGASNHPALLPVTTAAQGNAFKAQYAGWVAGGGTNWDQGFATVANAVPAYDLAILLTDGNPTLMRSGAGTSAYNTLRDVDSGIFSANQLKAEGTRVVAVGVGPALTANSEFNLRAVSGQTKGSDYFRAANFAEATAAITALANKNCQGSIGVQKLIVPAGGTIADATPAPAGWQFDATSVVPASVTVNAPATQLTKADGAGKVDFGLTFPGAANSGAVQILETQQTGYTVVPVGTGASARNAVCVNAETGAAVSVTNAGTPAQPGFTVNGLKNQRVECKIYNRAPLPGAIVVEKSSDPASGSVVVPGQEITYTLTFRNTGGLPVAVDHDDVLTDVLDDADLQGAITAQAPLSAALNGTGDRIRITGTVAPGAELTVSYTVKVKDPLPSGANAVLRNVVVPTGETPPETCEPNEPCTEHPVKVTLTWNKVDGVGTRLSGSEWLLTPYNAADVLDPTNAIAVIDCVAASAAACVGPDRDPQAGGFLLTGLTPGKYQLTETKAPAGFMLLDAPIEITVNTNVTYGDIENVQIGIPGIPLTGGLGSLMFVVMAGGLGGVAVLGIWWQRRRKNDAAVAA